MKFKNYDELVKYAKQYESDIDKLRVLQKYFLENVDYEYLLDVNDAIQNNDYGLNAFEDGKKLILLQKKKKRKY